MDSISDKIEKKIQEKGRLIYYDPTELAGLNYEMEDGTIPSNVSWNPEDLTMDIDLQVIIPSNYDCGQIDYFVKEKKVLTENEANSWVSFMQGNLQSGANNFLTTDYTNISFSQIKDDKVVSKEDLGITGIEVNFDAHFYPIVTIKMVDVRGSALLTPSEYQFDNQSVAMELENRSKNGENVSYQADTSTTRSFFDALFRYPYPRFLLSIKGFYGNRITFTLAPLEFNTNFNSSNGDFEVTIKFMGYVYGLYTDLPLDLIIASPYFNETYWSENDAFRYNKDGKSGNRIYTFPEFIKQIQTLSENIDTNALLSNSQIVEYNSTKEEIEALDVLNDVYSAFIKAISIPNNKGMKIEGESYDFYFIKIQDNKVSIEYDTDKLSEYQKQLKKYFETYNKKKEFESALSLTEDEISCGKVFKSTFIDEDGKSLRYKNVWAKVNDCLKFNENGYLIGYENSTLKKIFDSSNETKLKVNKEASKGLLVDSFVGDLENCYFCVYKKELVFKYIQKEKENLIKTQQKLRETVSEGMVDIYEQALGFKPTVENIYRMIFAHIDCFMDYFYKSMKTIYEENNNGERKSGLLGLTPHNSDIRKESVKIAPFPAYYESKNDGKKTKQYPGNAVDKPKLSEIEEVNMISTICKKIETFTEDLEESIDISTNEIQSDFSEIVTLADLLKGRGNYNAGWNSLLSSLKDDTSQNDPYCILYTVVCEYIINKYLDDKSLDSGKDNEKFNKWIVEHINRKLSLLNGKFSSLYNLGVMLTQLSEGNKLDNWTNYLESNFSINKEENERKGILRLVELPKAKDGNIYFYPFFDEIPQYFNNPFLINKYQDGGEIPFVENVDRVSICSYNGVLSDYTFSECKKIYEDIKNVGISRVKEVSIVDEDDLNGVWSNDCIKEGIYQGIEKKYFQSLSNKDKRYKQMFLTEDVGAETRFFGIIKWSNKKYKNLFSDGYSDNILELVCSNETDEKKYCAFAYIMLSLLCGSGGNTLVKFLEDIEENETCLYNVDKIDLLLLGAFLYRRDIDGDIFKNYTTDEKWKKAGLDHFFDNEIQNFLVDKNRFIRNKSDGYIFSGYVGVFADMPNSRKITLPSVLEDSPNAKRAIKNYFVNWVKNEFIPIFNDLKTTDDNCQRIFYNTFNYWIYIYKYGSVPERWLYNLFTSREYMLIFNPRDSSLLNRDDVKHISKKIGEIFKKTEEEKKEATSQKYSTDTNIDIQTKLYYILKELYNKWLCTYTAKNWKLKTVEEEVEARKKRFESLDTVDSKLSEFSNFLYIDQFYNDISDNFIINPNTIVEVINRFKSGLVQMNTYQFLQHIAQENNLMLLSLPVFNNLYDKRAFAKIFTPNNIYNGNNGGRGYGSTYVLIYTNEVSNKADITTEREYDFNIDYPDIANIFESNFSNDIQLFQENQEKTNYKVAAFGVSFGKQNQMYFKRINVNTDNPSVTNESLKNLLMISDAGKDGDLTTPSTIGQNIYSIYSNRAYTCTVEMMGCMNIMPLMYFQLNNIPLFRGAYMIINVKHSIQAGQMTTTFTGVRISKYIQPVVSSYIIADTLLNKLENATIRSGRVNISDKDDKNKIFNEITNGNRDVPSTLDKENITKEYVEKNLLTKIKVPIYNENGGKEWREIEVNKFLTDKIINIFSLISCGRILTEDEIKTYSSNGDFPNHPENSKYLINGKPFKFSEIGTYCFRNTLDTNMKPTKTLSWHSFGIAFDINGSINKYIKTNEYSTLKITADTEFAIRTWDHPVVKAFLEYGFGWGIYKTRYDYMHFSYMTSVYEERKDDKTKPGDKSGLKVGH